jgi:hypothetical protein
MVSLLRRSLVRQAQCDVFEEGTVGPISLRFNLQGWSVFVGLTCTSDHDGVCYEVQSA